MKNFYFSTEYMTFEVLCRLLRMPHKYSEKKMPRRELDFMCMETPDFCFTDLSHGERIFVEVEKETGESTYHVCQSQEVAGHGK